MQGTQTLRPTFANARRGSASSSASVAWEGVPSAVSLSSCEASTARLSTCATAPSPIKTSPKSPYTWLVAPQRERLVRVGFCGTWGCALRPYTVTLHGPGPTYLHQALRPHVRKREVVQRRQMQAPDRCCRSHGASVACQRVLSASRVSCSVYGVQHGGGVTQSTRGTWLAAVRGSPARVRRGLAFVGGRVHSPAVVLLCMLVDDTCGWWTRRVEYSAPSEHGKPWMARRERGARGRVRAMEGSEGYDIIKALTKEGQRCGACAVHQ